MLDDRSKLRLLFAVARAGGPTTQGEVAAALAMPKVEARRWLREAVAEGLVEEAIDDSPAQPGRRTFWINQDTGTAELDRLKRTVWNPS